MRIGFFADEFLPRLDGVIVSMLSTAEGLRKLGHEVYFIVPAYPGHHGDEFTIRVPSSAGPLNDNIRLMLPNWRIRKVIGGLNLDIIHSHTPLTAGILARKAAQELNLPHIATFHTLLPVIIDYYPVRSKTIYAPVIAALLSDILWSSNLSHYIPPASAGKSNSRRWAWRVTAAYADSVDLVISPSKHYAHELKQLGISVPVKVLPTGLDLTGYKANNARPNQPLHLIAVGRLSEEKRQGVLLESIASLPKSLVTLNLVGDGQARDKLESVVEKKALQNVEFSGAVQPSQIPQLLSKANVGVMVSHGFDTQCLALVEYMAAGLPVLYCDSNLKEVVGPDAGLLTKPDAKSITDGLLYLSKNLKIRQRMSVAAVKRSKEYSYMATAKKLEKIYQDFL